MVNKDVDYVYILQMPWNSNDATKKSVLAPATFDWREDDGISWKPSQRCRRIRDSYSSNSGPARVGSWWRRAVGRSRWAAQVDGNAVQVSMRGQKRRNNSWCERHSRTENVPDHQGELRIPGRDKWLQVIFAALVADVCLSVVRPVVICRKLSKIDQ